MPLTSISFKNDLAYDVIVYDSSNPDNPTDAENNYMGELVSLGTVTANSALDIMPLQPGSAFVIENATIYKPVKRCTTPPISKIKSFTIDQTDEDAMTTTLKFIDFILHNKEDAMTKAFNAVLTGNSDDLLTSVNNFFALYPDYKDKCTFQTYMMGIAYVSLHPESIAKPPEEATYSLSKLIECLGGTWPDGLPDITVSKFTCTTPDNVLTIKMIVDLSSLTFQSDAIKENALSLFTDTKVKAELTLNFGFGLGIFGTRLTLEFDNFKIPLGGDNQISVTKPTITIDINPLFKFVVFTLRGIIPFNMFSKAFDANISLTIDNLEAHIGVEIEGDKTSFPAPPGLKGLHFDEFGVGMGVFFKPPGFALGLQGKFHIGEPAGGNVIDLNDDTFALVCKIEEEVPVPVYISFYVPKMDANKVLELFTDVSPNFDVPVEFSDMSFRWAADLMEPIVLPDGSLTEMAYGFSAAINIYSFGFYGDVAIDMNNGLTADVETSPLNWNNVFKMSGDGKGVTIKVDENGNPIRNNEIRDQKVLKDALAKATDKQIVTAGGPVLIINTFKLPILHLNAKVSLFNLADYAIEADINKDGIRFMLDYGIILKEKMSVTLSDFHNLSGSFKYYIDQTIKFIPDSNVYLGAFHLTADAEIHFSINTTPSDIVLSVGGKFDFEGMTRSFGDFSADIHISKMTDFLEAIGRYIEQEAKQIFGDFINDAKVWAAKAKAGFISGYDDVSKVLKDQFKADSIAVASIMQSVGYTSDEIANGIKNAWNCGVGDVTYAMKAVGYRAEEISNSLKNTFNAGAQDVTNALKAMGFSPDEIASNLKDTFNADSVAVASIMKSAGYTADEVAGGIKNAWNCGATDVAYAMKGAGYAADEVSNCLKNTFNSSVNDVAAAMKNVGYTADQVASTLKDTFNIGVNDVANAMKAVGYASDQVENAFKSLGGDFEDFASKTWDKINPSHWL